MIERIARRCAAAFGLVVCCFVASCATLDEDFLRRWEIQHAMQPVDSAGLHGRYINASPLVSVPGFFLWSQLGGGDRSLASDVVEIGIVGDEARFRLIRGGVAVDSLEDGATMMQAYATMSSFRIGGIPPLLWAVSGDETALGVGGDGALSLARNAGGAMFIGPLPFAAGGSPFALTYMPAP